MKYTLMILITFVPIIALGQDKNNIKDDFQSQTLITTHPISKLSSDSEENLKTLLVDDRKFSKSLIPFDFDKSYNLSFTEKHTRLFEYIDNNDSHENLLESEPFLDLRWRLRK